MNLAQLARELRATAARIEELLMDEPLPVMGNGNERLEHAVEHAVLAGSHPRVVRHRKATRRRNGLHWTQKPENQATLQKLVRKMKAGRKAAAARA